MPQSPSSPQDSERAASSAEKDAPDSGMEYISHLERLHNMRPVAAAQAANSSSSRPAPDGDNHVLLADAPAAHKFMARVGVVGSLQPVSEVPNPEARRLTIYTPACNTLPTVETMSQQMIRLLLEASEFILTDVGQRKYTSQRRGKGFLAKVLPIRRARRPAPEEEEGEDIDAPEERSEEEEEEEGEEDSDFIVPDEDGLEAAEAGAEEEEEEEPQLSPAERQGDTVQPLRIYGYPVLAINGDHAGTVWQVCNDNPVVTCSDILDIYIRFGDKRTTLYTLINRVLRMQLTEVEGGMPRGIPHSVSQLRDTPWELERLFTPEATLTLLRKANFRVADAAVFRNQPALHILGGQPSWPIPDPHAINAAADEAAFAIFDRFDAGAVEHGVERRIYGQICEQVCIKALKFAQDDALVSPSCIPMQGVELDVAALLKVPAYDLRRQGLFDDADDYMVVARNFLTRAGLGEMLEAAEQEAVALERADATITSSNDALEERIAGLCRRAELKVKAARLQSWTALKKHVIKYSTEIMKECEKAPLLKTDAEKPKKAKTDESILPDSEQEAAEKRPGLPENLLVLVKSFGQASKDRLNPKMSRFTRRNMSLVGNVMSEFVSTASVTGLLADGAHPGVVNLYFSALTALHYMFSLHSSVCMHGPAQMSKTYMCRVIKCLMADGTFMQLESMSAKWLANDKHMLFHAILIDEVKKEMFDPVLESTDSLKSALTECRYSGARNESASADDSRKVLKLYMAIKMVVFIMCTNHTVPKNTPLGTRINFVSAQRFGYKRLLEMSSRAAAEDDVYQSRIAHITGHVKQGHVHCALTEWMKACYALPVNVEMYAFETVFDATVNYLQMQHGLPKPDQRTRKMVRGVARSMTIFCAVQIALMSPIARDYDGFTPNMLLDVMPLLYCTREIALNAIMVNRHVFTPPELDDVRRGFQAIVARSGASPPNFAGGQLYTTLPCRNNRGIVAAMRNAGVGETFSDGALTETIRSLKNRTMQVSLDGGTASCPIVKWHTAGPNQLVFCVLNEFLNSTTDNVVLDSVLASSFEHEPRGSMHLIHPVKVAVEDASGAAHEVESTAILHKVDTSGRENLRRIDSEHGDNDVFWSLYADEEEELGLSLGAEPEDIDMRARWRHLRNNLLMTSVEIETATRPSTTPSVFYLPHSVIQSYIHDKLAEGEACDYPEREMRAIKKRYQKNLDAHSQRAHNNQVLANQRITHSAVRMQVSSVPRIAPAPDDMVRERPSLPQEGYSYTRLH